MTILQVQNDLQAEPSSRKRQARRSDDKAVSVMRGWMAANSTSCALDFNVARRMMSVSND